MEKICSIISGGDFAPLTGIEKSDFIIACDKGLDYARKEGITPNLIVGDFDSFTGSLPDDIPILPLPVMKDDTDTMAAVRHAIDSHQFGKITLYCALGGRLDHLFANLQAGAFAASAGLTVEIIDENTQIIIMPPGELKLPPKKNYSLSLFSLSDTCLGVNISGAVYPLNDAEIRSTFPIGVSNQWVSDVTISFREGILMVILSRLPNA